MSRFQSLIIFIIILLSIKLNFAAAESVATLYSAEGNVEGRFVSGDWKEVSPGQKFENSDAVRTNERSTAGVKFNDGFLVRLKEKTSIEFAKKQNTQPISISVGTAYFFSRKPTYSPEIHTPQVSASVRGTEFVVEVTKEQTVISVIQGVVEATNQFGSLTLNQGELAVTKTGSAPVKQIIINPLDAVQWALYYPAVFRLSDFKTFANSANSKGIAALNEGKFKEAKEAFSGSTWMDQMGRSLVAYQEGNVREALKEIETQKTAVPELLLYQSSLLLSVGETDQANTILLELSRKKTADVEAGILTQLAVIDLVQNKKNQARSKAEQALKLDSKSPAALLVSSYISQSFFKLDEARESLEKILADHPADLLAKIRLAELLLGSGETKKATELVESVINKTPNNEYALSILGFTELSRYQEKEALGYFTKALSINDSFAMAHLGKGLALIRGGDLKAGREELEIATQLAPNISLYRSYLGKAFYEEEKSELSENEYLKAMELDSQDPTPYLYRSFLRLSQHRPIEALADIEDSIARNDNRAVFRSKLLLDQDEATRGTSLGKIYSRVGFNELSRVEAMKALNSDYSNYSAHFLLGSLFQDSNLGSNTLTTENLIGRLLVPVNYNSNNLDLNGGGASLNEYTTLFSRPISRTKISANGDSSLEEISAQIDQTLTTNNLGLKVGFLASDRQGFRNNDWKREKQGFVQGQYQLLEDDTLIFDATGRQNDQADVVVNTDPYAEDPDLETSLDSGLLRLGYHHRFSANSHFIAQTFYDHGNFSKQDNADLSRISSFDITDQGKLITTVPFPFDGATDEDIRSKQDLSRSDLQYILDTEDVSFVIGTSFSFEHLNNSEDAIVSDIGSKSALSFLEGYVINSDANVNQNTNQTFIYSKWHPLNWFNLDAGITYAHLTTATNPDSPPFVSDTYDKDSFDPKVGAIVELSKDFSLRTCYETTLGRNERGGIGPLEPTFVGGFNQVFDGIRGSKQDLYAVGIDGKLSTKTYIGTSYQLRKIDLNRPFTSSLFSIESGELTTTVVDKEDSISNSADENRVSAYLYQILGLRWSLAVKYDWENFNEQQSLPDFDTNVGTLNLRYFDPSGFFSFVKSTFRNQHRKGSGIVDPNDSFWIFDAGLGYELDSSHGFASLEFRNIFDQSFKYSAIRDESFLLPEFGALLKMSYNF